MKSRTEWENSSNSLSDSKIKILSFASIFLWYLLLLFSDITAIFPQIDISVCIDLDVFPIAGQQQIQDMKSIKLSNPTPTATAIWTTLQLFVIIRIDPVYERSNSYLIRMPASLRLREKLSTTGSDSITNVVWFPSSLFRDWEMPGVAHKAKAPSC